MKATHVLLVAALLPTSGCALFGITSKVEVEHALTELESGVTYRDTLPGEGPPAELGDELVLEYTGFLEDGSVFDSSIDRGIPIEIVLGEAPLEGWNDGLLGMRAGGRRHVSIPSKLAYGAAGVEGLIPPDEPLVFDFELLEIRAD